MTDPFTPRPEHHFTFGLWTVGNPGRDPVRPRDAAAARSGRSGAPARGSRRVRRELPRRRPRPARVVAGGARGDREAVPPRARRDRHEGADGDDQPVLATGVQGRRVHRERSRGPAVTRCARRSTRSTSASSSAPTVYVMWGGREGVESRRGQGRPARARPLQGGRRPLLRVHPRPRLRPARSRSSPSRTSRAATSSCRRSATRSRSSSELEWPDMVGLNPEFAHETMSGLSFHHAVAQTLWHGKLFHIDLNAQRIGKYDQDFRFGSEGIRDAFYLVKLLEDAEWDGMRHFDAHAYRTEDADGVWDFARGCMRTYLILREKARRFHEDAEIQEALRSGAGRRPRRADAARRAALDAIARCGRLRRRRARRPGLRPRAPRPTRHRAVCSAARVVPLVVGVDSSTQSMQGRGARRRHRRARRVGPGAAPATTPPRSEQDPEDWWAAFAAACAEAGVPRPAPSDAAIASPGSSTAWSCSTPTVRCCARRSCGTTPSRRPTRTARRRAPGGAAAWAAACGSVPVAAFTITKLLVAAPLRARRVRTARRACCCRTTG